MESAEVGTLSQDEIEAEERGFVKGFRWAVLQTLQEYGLIAGAHWRKQLDAEEDRERLRATLRLVVHFGSELHKLYPLARPSSSPGQSSKMQ
jgi:hypothetical protein